MSIKKQAIQGVRWSLVASILVTAGSLVQLYILIRIIDKSDFGLMAMVHVVLAFVMPFLDFGLGSAIIHKKDVTEQQASTLYWMVLLMGFLLSGIVYLSAPWVASFYNETRLVFLLRMMSVVFLINAFGAQFMIFLRKNLQFNRIAFIDIVSFFISFVLVVYFALSGYGVLSLVFSFLAKELIRALLSIFWGRIFFTPRLVFEFSETRFFLHFGSYLLGNTFLNFFNKQIDVILIGRFLGADVLGGYDLVKRLLSRPFQFVNPIITGVSFPVLSKLQHNPEQVASVYLKQMNHIGSINFPIYIFLLFNAQLVMDLVFGSVLNEYLFVFQVLAVYFLFYVTGNPVGTLLNSQGKPQYGFYWNLATVLLIPLAIFISLSFGLEIVVVTLLGIQIVLVYPSFYFLVRSCARIGASQYFLVLFRPFILSGVMGVTCFLLSLVLPFGSLTNLIILFFWGAGWYFVLSKFFNRSFYSDFIALLTTK